MRTAARTASRQEQRGGRQDGLSWPVVLVVALMHLVAGVWLSVPTRAGPDAVASERLRLSWVERAPPLRPPQREDAAAAPASASTGRMVVALIAAPAAPPAPPSPPTVADDTWRPLAPTGERARASRFSRSPLQREEPDPFAATRHLPGVQLRDGSAIGVLHAIGKGVDCGELRARMRSSPESTESAMASMRRLGCPM